MKIFGLAQIVLEILYIPKNIVEQYFHHVKLPVIDFSVKGAKSLIPANVILS